MEETLQNTPYRSGFVAVMGRPNVGKSTLINALMGQKIAAVSPRPQTTRKMQLGILTQDNAQIIFVDTPGLHKPRHKLGKYMNQNAAEALEDADLILFVVDASQMPPHEEDRILGQLLVSLSTPPKVILAINKIDCVDEETLAERETAYLELLPQSLPIRISALRGEHLSELLETLVAHIPEEEPYYPEEQVTDLYEREIAADLIRAAALIHLRDEVPHAIAIRVDEYTERGDHGAYIDATIFVERDSQKGIAIGRDGRMLKLIGTTARQEIEAMSGRKSYLRLRVKVRKNWRNDENTLRRFGFRLKK
ncbi:MAG: GTPase Era [Chloroflexi bacterium]|nr:GTPase Era [Chloroflexota bacterium]